MAYASEWLVELEAYTGSEVVTLRYSVNGFTTHPGDVPANTTYDARISGIGAFSRALFTEGRTTGAASVEMSDLTLSNADGELDALKGYAVDGRRFVLKRLPYDAPYSSAQTVLTGTMEGIDASAGSLTLMVRFYDRRRDIDVPLQEEKYAGTTTSAGPTAEGSEDLKDRIKPLVFGRCFSVPATIVNDFNMFLQFSASQLHEIQLYDGGVPLINDGDVATLADLAAATGNPGHYKTCLAQGIARPFGTFNGRPAFTWTADVAESGNLADHRAGAIVQRMLARIGIDSSQLDVASFAQMNSAVTAELGIYFDSETTVLSATSEITRSVGASLVPDHLGRFVIGRLDAPGVPIASITEPEILTSSKDETLAFASNPDTDGQIPTHSILLKYRRHWHVHSDSDLGHCANFADPTRGSSLKQEWREVRAEDPAVLARHLLSREVEVETFLVDAAAALAEAERRLGLYGVDRTVVRVSVDLDQAAVLQMNETVELIVDRFSFIEGKAMRIIGRVEDFAAEKLILTLWG